MGYESELDVSLTSAHRLAMKKPTERAKRNRIAGLWVPIITPLHDDGSLDVVSLDRLAGSLLDAGVDGLVALGTTGEPATLDAAERRRVVEVCDAVCRERGAGLLIGAGTNATAGTIEEIGRMVARTSAAGVLIVVPYYTRPSAAAVVDHFGLIADASPVPVVMYNIPYRTGRGLDAADLLAAGRHGNIVGLKQAVGALDVDTLGLLAEPERGFAVLAGDDAFITPTILLGGDGAIAAAAHLCTDHFVAMVRSARSGDVVGASALAGRLLPLVRAGFAEPSPAVWKGALARLGMIESDAVRRPLTATSASAAVALLEIAERFRQTN